MSYTPDRFDQKSAFGELQVAQLTPIYQQSFEYTVSNTELTTNTTVGSGTVTQASAMAVVGTGTTTGSTAMMQSRRHSKYAAGQGGLMRFTSLFTSPVAGTEQYQGLMDEAGSAEAFKNGYAVGYDGTTFGFHRWQNDTLITVAQASWDDPMDGTGPSGMTLDQTKLNVFAIQFEYLGAGSITLLVEDDTTGDFVKAHTVHYSNQNTTPSVHNPNFHHTIWTNNGATTSNMILKTGSYAYFIEGLHDLLRLDRPQFSSGKKQKTSVTTEVAIFTIRNKSTYASKTNFIDITLEMISASIEASSANNLGEIRVVRDATLGGSPSYVDISATDSVVEIDTAGTTVSSGKELFSYPLAGKNDALLEDIVNMKIILGPGEALTVSGTSANSATINAAVLWKELF